LQGRDHPRLVIRGPAEDEVESHQGLSGARWAGHERGASRSVALGEHPVEGGDTGRDSAFAQPVAILPDGIGKPGEHRDAIAREAIRVPSGAKVAPAQLGHLDQAQRALVGLLSRQRDDSVGHGEFRRCARLVRAVFADPEAGGREGREQRGEIVQEAPELASVRRECGQRLEAVDRDDSRPPLLDQRGDALGDGGKPVLPAHCGTKILVEDRPADRGAIEEAEGLGVPEDLLERLRDRREVDRRPLLSRAGEDQLLAEDRLSRARQPHDQIDAVHRQTTAEDPIQALVAACSARVH
jgi:hypothetical protein